FVRIANAANEADGIEERSSEAGLGNWLLSRRDNYTPEDDLVVVTVDGQVVGYGWVDWVQTTDGKREYRTRGLVDPPWRRQGVGSAILAHNEARLLAIAAGHPDDLPRVFGAFAPERRIGAVALITGAGYQPVRYFFDMVRPTLDDIDLPPLPEGLEIRGVSDLEGYRRLFAADTEAFMDHWGGFDASEASFQQWLRDPNFDPSLFVIAWDGDEIAGGVINAIDAEENEALDRRRGLLDSVFVRRPWRRRGLASALVGRSLALLRERGMTSALLGVDADNPTGALGVYERAGFEVDLRSSAYHKPMEISR
ncbi:MAG TPA: GNAT family N-acetyltransferase, partial [Candidatus Limnocylindria bacterium]|nr:GNAT family N-acetyltransferase [Candidatus Limnocylindria bacterium]